MYFSQACQDKFVLSILKGKRNGHFLEIGSHHPIHTNNTYTLEKNFDWRGIMIERDDAFIHLYKEYRPNSAHVIQDATTIDYKSLLETNNMPAEIDYLQIDLEANERSTLTALEMFDNTVFDTYKFATITFEHDVYLGNHFDTREASRRIFDKRGYVRIFPDVCDHNTAIVFEDWYVHPDLVDMDYVRKLMDDNAAKYVVNSITGKSINCQDIIYNGNGS